VSPEEETKTSPFLGLYASSYLLFLIHPFISVFSAGKNLKDTSAFCIKVCNLFESCREMWI